MKSTSQIIFAFLLTFCSLNAAEYFVGVNGSDKNSGLTESSPFRTLKHVATLLRPGDTVTMLPGEYHQEVLFSFNGDPKRPTRIRAKIPGSVHMRGDIPAPEFTKVPGRKNVYMCQVSKMPEYILERDTLQKFKKVPSLSEVELTSCSSFLDEKNNKIYIRTSDDLPPERHTITFSVLQGDAIKFHGGGKPVYNCHVSGIMFSGYNAATPKHNGKSSFAGVHIRNPQNCSVKNCIVYLCGCGVMFIRFADSIVEDCVFFANHTEFNSSGGNLICYGPGKNTIQRNIITFGSEMAGQRFYSGSFNNCLIENCFAFDNKYGDIWIKPASNTAVVKNSYASYLMRARRIENGIFTSGATYYNGKAQRSISRPDEPRFDPDKEFADPAHLDFRLRKDSIFRKGGERGPRGYDPKVIFDDEKQLVSGGTLYITRKRSTPLRLKDLKDIIIRGRGLMPAVLKGDLKLENCRNVRLENINFMGKAEFPHTSQLTLRRCAFAASVTLPAKTRIHHNLFLKDVRSGDGTFARGNIFCASFSTKPLFSGWNAYTATSVPAFETASWKAPKPIFNAPASGDFTLKNHSLFAGRCADGFPNGQYRYDAVPNAAVPLFTKNNITARSAGFTLSMPGAFTATAGLKSADGKNIVRKNSKTADECVFTFASLKPGTRYTISARITPAPVKRLTNAPKVKSSPRSFTLSFTTPAKDAPRVWHVSAKGDNANDGSSFDKAIAEINSAIRRAGPGDTILIAEGTYKEMLRVTSTGSSGRYLRIAGVPGAQVRIDGDGKIIYGSIIQGREYVELDNLIFCNLEGSGAYPDASGVLVTDSAEIKLKRIFYDNRNGSNERSFVGRHVKNLLIENCVAITPFGGYEFSHCPDLEIRHCVFFRGKTLNGRVHTTMAAPAKVHHCIFVGQEIQKVKNPTFGAAEISTFTEHDNGFFVRLPRHEKPCIGFNSFKGKILPKNDGGGILNKEWNIQGRFYNQTLTYDDFCKEQNRKPTAVFGDPKMKGLPYFHTFKSLAQWDKDFHSKDPAMQKKLREARQKELFSVKDLRITDFIATAPGFRARKIGLDPEAFK